MEAVDPGSLDRTPDGVAEPLDLNRVEADLAGVEAALVRLDAGTYFHDEVTGEPLPDELLDADPTARRAAPV